MTDNLIAKLLVHLRHEDTRLWGCAVIVLDPERHLLADDIALLLILLDNDLHGHLCFCSQKTKETKGCQFGGKIKLIPVS